MRKWILVLAAGVLFVPSVNSYAAWSGEIASDIWQLAPTPRSSRWLVIHHRAAANIDGIYHIEVLERAVGAPVWQIKHLAPHMAISSTALRASIIKPLKRGAVYPEIFNFAYADWKAQQALVKAVICESSVVECIN